MIDLYERTLTPAKTQRRRGKTLLKLYLGNHFLRHPLHVLEGFCRRRSAYIEDHGINAYLTVVPNIRCDLFGIAQETPALTWCDLLFSIEERALESHADPLRVSSRLLGVTCEHLQVPRHVLRLQGNCRNAADRMPTVAHFSRSTHSLLTVAADPDRNGRRLHRFREENDVGEAAMFSMEGWIVLRPKLSKGFYVFFGHSTPLAERRRLQVIEFFLHPADAQSDDHPPPRKHVETRQHLGRNYRISIGRDHDAGNESNAVCGTGKKGHGHQGFQMIAGAGIFAVYGVGIRDRYVFGNNDVIGDGNAVKTQCLSSLNEPDQIL